MALLLESDCWKLQAVLDCGNFFVQNGGTKIIHSEGLWGCTFWCNLIVLLNGLGSGTTNIYLRKSSNGEPGICHCSRYIALGPAQNSPGTLLFIHTFSGCNTISAPFGKWKTKFPTSCTKYSHNTEPCEVSQQRTSLFFWKSVQKPHTSQAAI